MIPGIQKANIVPILDREMDNLTSEQKFLISLYSLGEQYCSKPQTIHHEAIINATAWLIDLLSEEVSCG